MSCRSSAVILVIGACLGVVGEAAAEALPAPDVTTDRSGTVTARATLRLPGPPAAVKAVLTDYAHWPELFTTPLRVAGLERRPDAVLTDLYIGHPWWFGEKRLLCETRELPGGRLKTSLVAGDFRAYERTWALSENGAPDRTQAEFELVVALDTWAPDWLVVWELRRQLQGHFEQLSRRVRAQVSSSRRGR